MSPFIKKTVQQILDRKGREVWAVKPDNTVLEALEFMAEKNIGAVVVVEDEMPAGILSERDVARKIALEGRKEAETLVHEVMTSQVIGVREDHEIDTCLALMTGNFIRHLPVVNDEQKVIGVISIGDLVKEVVDEQHFMIEQLVMYISGETDKVPVPEPKSVELP